VSIFRVVLPETPVIRAGSVRTRKSRSGDGQRPSSLFISMAMVRHGCSYWHQSPWRRPMNEGRS
jgi:hypothetical protein